MFKLIFTLLRGRAHDAEQGFIDRNALPLLQQQIREAARGVEAARKAVAVAIAQNGQEAENSAQMSARIADLEVRAVEALKQGREALAAEAAETIAFLETELEVSKKAQAEFSSGIEKLKTIVRNSEMRLAELQRGERLATARDRAQRLSHAIPGSDLATLSDAEETLARLKNRQQEVDLTASALADMKRGENPATIIEKLAEAGCGQPLRTTGADVLKRLRAGMPATE